MTEQERELDIALAEAEQENRLLRARNERLEREAEANIKDAYRAGVNSGIAAEREACAKVVTDNAHMFATPQAAESLAKAIQARGNT